MRYVRTKNEIYDRFELVGMEFESIEAYICRNAIKYADTIEKLCDVFVYIKENDVNKQFLTIDFNYKDKDEYCRLLNGLTVYSNDKEMGISKEELETGEVKCAIWTDKGLIYVGKMNKKGEFELL